MRKLGLTIATLLSVPGLAVAQVGPPPGSSPAPGVGLGADAGAHDTLAVPDAAEQAARAARERADSAAASNARGGGRAVPATAADLVIGATVNDRGGHPLGQIESIGVDGVVVAAHDGRVAVPAEAFGKSRRGLLLDLAKADFDRLVAAAVAPATHP